MFYLFCLYFRTLCFILLLRGGKEEVFISVGMHIIGLGHINWVSNTYSGFGMHIMGLGYIVGLGYM